MAKKKDYVSKDPNKLHFLSKHGIIIYPIPDWYIEVDNNGVKKRFKKKIKSNEIDDAIWATVNYYCELLNNRKKDEKKRII